MRKWVIGLSIGAAVSIGVESKQPDWMPVTPAACDPATLKTEFGSTHEIDQLHAPVILSVGDARVFTSVARSC